MDFPNLLKQQTNNTNNPFPSPPPPQEKITYIEMNIISYENNEFRFMIIVL